MSYAENAESAKNAEKANTIIALSILLCVLCALCVLCIAGISSAHVEATPIVVASDGTGQFTSVQAAVDSIPSGSTERHIIQLRPGAYRERVRVTKDKPPITLKGEDPTTTLITWKLGAKDINPDTGKETGTDGTATVSIEANDFEAQHIAFENSYGPGSQAVAVKVTSDRVVFRHCRFLGFQDTLYIKAHDGRHYFADCYVEGAVDFIFGRSTAVFERCEIKSTGKGYVTAPSTEPGTRYGYVFTNCKLTASDAVEPGTVYLGRPWRPHGAAVFMHCELGAHVRPEGWDNWRDPAKEKTARFAEFDNTGPGADTSERVGWARQLTADEAADYDPGKVLAGADGWNPRGR